MPFYARKPTTKRSAKKRYTRRRPTLDKKIRTIAKSMVLKTSETKVNLRTYDQQAVTHNAATGERLGFFNLLLTSQGTGDGTNDINLSNNRIGDEIIPSGIKMYISIDQLFEFPDVQYRLVVVKTKGNLSITGVQLQDITEDNTVDPIVKEQPVTVVYDKLFRARNPLMGRHDNTLSHNKDSHIIKKVWIPLGNRKYKYSSDNSLYGLNYNLSAFIYAYDARITTVGQQLGTVRFATQLFFKDP